MTNPGDNEPLAPRRQLGKSASTAEAPAAEQSTHPSSRSAYPAGDETGTTLPVRESQQQAVSDQAVRDQAVRDRAAEKAAQKAARRAAAKRPTRTRRARLRLTRIDPWSVTKTAFLLSIAFGIMCCVAVFLVFSIMSAAGLWDHINTTIQGVVNQQPGNQFDIKQYVGMSRVMGVAILISAIDVVLITALATLGAFIYNLSAAVLGGVEVTLAEDLK